MRITTTGALIAIQTTATTVIVGDDDGYSGEEFTDLLSLIGLKGVELESDQWDYYERDGRVVWVIDGMSDPRARVSA